MYVKTKVIPILAGQLEPTANNSENISTV